MTDSKITIGDCLDTLRSMPDGSIDAVVTDPPYGLGREPDPREVLRAWLDGEAYQPGGRGFMGRAWDAFVPSPLVWAECHRVLKPGGHLLAFAGSRTYDWIVLGVRLAGLEVRDQLMWLYGSGFPKSHNLKGDHEGWGTALKPAHEPIVMARKPLVGTVAHNVTTHGTGAINVDGCRVGTGGELRKIDNYKSRSDLGLPATSRSGRAGQPYETRQTTQGRWPANIMHDGSPEVLAGFPVSQVSGAARTGRSSKATPTGIFGTRSQGALHDDTGTAARFFYHAKASRAERERGLTHREPETVGDGRAKPNHTAYQRGATQRLNIHPTVKPVAVMRWLVRLVTPTGGTVLDPYAGSGTTGIAATLEGFDFIGCELSHEYAQIARDRIRHAESNPHQWDPEIDPPAADEPETVPGQTSLLDLV